MVFLFCAIAAAVGLAGAAALRKQSFFWAGGLLIGGLAAIAYAGAMAGSDVAFKLYYALGASMLPGWVGVGSLQVAFSRRLVRWPAIFVIMLSAAQLGLTLPAGVNPEALARLGGGNGAGVLLPGAWVAPTVLFNTFGLGFAAVAAFFAWWRAFRLASADRAQAVAAMRPDAHRAPGESIRQVRLPTGSSAPATARPDREYADRAAVAVGLSLVVVGILCRSDAVYRLLVAGGFGSAFLLADAVAFALVWAGARACRALPGPLQRLLLPDQTPVATGRVPSP